MPPQKKAHFVHLLRGNLAKLAKWRAGEESQRRERRGEGGREGGGEAKKKDAGLLQTLKRTFYSLLIQGDGRWAWVRAQEPRLFVYWGLELVHFVALPSERG